MWRKLLVGTLVAGAIVSGCKCKQDVYVNGGDGGGGPGGDGGGYHGDGGADFVDGGFYQPDGAFFMGGGVDPGGFVLGDGGNGTGLGNGVSVNPDAGGLVLNGQTIQLHYVWIANNTQGWVSKYDSDTGKEVARYYSVLPIDGAGNAVPVDYTQFNSPSRTGIDLYGNAWVGNRAPVQGVQGSVTKIANSLADCVDRNHNGKIDTSSDLNGDGVIDTDPDAGEFIVPTNPADPTQYDECVLFSTPVGLTDANVKARALAISAGSENNGGDIWVGVFDENKVLRLNSDTGAIQPVTPNNPAGPLFIQLSWGSEGSGPYGAVVDGQQRLWVTHAPGTDDKLALIDTTTGTLVTDQIATDSAFPGAQSYGMGIDGKDRVWLAGLWATDGSGTYRPYAFRYDNGPGLTTAAGVWSRFDLSSGTSAQGTVCAIPRGIAADDQGIVWVSCDGNSAPSTTQPTINAAGVVAINGDTGVVQNIGTTSFIDATDGNSNQSIGVGIDAQNNVWVNNYSGNAMKIDRNTGAVFKTPQQPAGLYTYSDFTGYELRHFTAPRGTYQEDFKGCGQGTNFRTLSWDAIQNPPTTQVEAYVEVGADVAILNDPATTQYGPFTHSPVDLTATGVPPAQYIRVIFVLISTDKQSTPVLEDFMITWDCNGTIG